MTEPQFDFGMVGLGVMGRNLLLNMADHGFKVIGFDLDNEKVAALETAANPGVTVKGVTSLEQMVQQLAKPAKIMLLVPAGKPVDDVIEDLLPFLAPGDIVIDGGNSHYADTNRRVAYLQGINLHFIGMGVSGGSSGARTGPSIMPGGDFAAWQYLQPILEAISAKVNDEPCVAYMGKDAAGHYVKMVHNGIEYAIMQLLTEIYDLLKRGIGLSNSELHNVFKQWNEGELQSYLVEITSNIFLQKDDITGNDLVDMILDKAGSKGTGKWTSQEAMELPVAIPTIDTAVAMRTMSSLKLERSRAAALFKPEVQPIATADEVFIRETGDALYAAVILCYAQGLSMLHHASIGLKMDIPLKDVVKIWRGGCIIRSSLLEIFYKAFSRNSALNSILLDDAIAGIIQQTIPALRKVTVAALQAGIPVQALTSALGYFDAYTCERMPTNLLQAQRDYFGAHTYERIDRDGKFHTEWAGDR